MLHRNASRTAPLMSRGRCAFTCIRRGNDTTHNRGVRSCRASIPYFVRVRNGIENGFDKVIQGDGTMVQGDRTDVRLKDIGLSVGETADRKVSGNLDTLGKFIRPREGYKIFLHHKR